MSIDLKKTLPMWWCIEGAPRPLPGSVICYEDSQVSAYSGPHGYDWFLFLFFTVKEYKAKSAKGKTSWGKFLRKPDPMFPRVLSQWSHSHRIPLVPPAISHDSTCEILSGREAH